MTPGRELELVGYDVVEVSGRMGGPVGGTARMAARIVLQLLLGKAPFEPLTDH